MKKIFFIFSLATLHFISLPQLAYAQLEKQAGASATIALATPINEDRRAKVLRAYLQTYNSPFADYAEVFVREADKNSIDWRLLVSISGVESTFGHQIPYNSYNAWGWGIYGNNTFAFSSWEEGITVISKELREQYMNQWNAQDVYQIGRLYAASPTWAVRVNGFIQKIDAFALKDTNSLPISL